MNYNRSLVFAVVNNRCPQCRIGKIFNTGPFSSQFLEVKDNCSHCGARLIPEPGFYYGAMYFTYAIQVAIIIAVLTMLNILLPDPRWYYYAITSTTIIVLTSSLCARISRSLMLHCFGGLKYKV